VQLQQRRLGDGQHLEQQQLEKAYDTWMKGIRDSAYVEIKTSSR